MVDCRLEITELLAHGLWLAQLWSIKFIVNYAKYPRRAPTDQSKDCEAVANITLESMFSRELQRSGRAVLTLAGFVLMLAGLADLAMMLGGLLASFLLMLADCFADINHQHDDRPIY